MNQQEEHFVKRLEALVQRLVAEEKKSKPSPEVSALPSRDA